MDLANQLRKWYYVGAARGYLYSEMMFKIDDANKRLKKLEATGKSQTCDIQSMFYEADKQFYERSILDAKITFAESTTCYGAPQNFAHKIIHNFALARNNYHAPSDYELVESF
jgi:hypothetical protein